MLKEDHMTHDAMIRFIRRDIRRALIALAAMLAWFLLCAALAWANPPPPGSDDAQIMQPFGPWITQQHDPAGRLCCSIADGRPVEARIIEQSRTYRVHPTCVACGDKTVIIEGPHWEAHVTPEHWPGEPDRWVGVPESTITHTENPVGVPILWMYNGEVRCFSPPGGV